MEKSNKKKPSWSDLKHLLADLDRKELITLVQELYKASKDNQLFLHTRFALGEDTLKTYKDTIDRWVNPNPMRNQAYSISKAKKAISDYKKAAGNPEGIAELTVFYCECCADFLAQVGIDDESFYNALIGMFEQSLALIEHMDEKHQASLMGRLDRVQRAARDWGWGVFDEMNDLMTTYGALAK